MTVVPDRDGVESEMPPKPPPVGELRFRLPVSVNVKVLPRVEFGWTRSKLDKNDPRSLARCDGNPLTLIGAFCASGSSPFAQSTNPQVLPAVTVEAAKPKPKRKPKPQSTRPSWLKSG